VTLSALGGGLVWNALRAPSGAPSSVLSLLGVGPVGSVMVWVGVLFLVALAGGFAVLLLRRWLLDADSADHGAGWDLRALRHMRDRGEISEEEFQLARSRIIDSMSKTRPPTPTGAGAPPYSGGELRAPPGFDLTGEPLPGGENAAPDQPEGPKK
jgi:hypothetical protein